ncbi:carboxypeptidase M32 [Listeria grandensis]|uniref:Metal-dependent carboxypeptidase n=1 Tax=Listeria grandensis TaxID=1494963 RepID=A0A7X0Y2A5_9LIST|nr:carboxypeptidase M32 [Listeria grandensis]MBC1935403.1 carboxypeptidase M32 [Listeria grandensis]
MSESLQELEQEFLDYVKKISAFEEALSLVYWDLRTGAPEKGVEGRSEVIGTLSGEIFKMKVSEEMAAFIAGLWVQKENLSDVTRRSLEECKKEYDLNKKIPAKEYEAYTKLVAQAETTWATARANNDYELFKPYLEKIIASKRKFVEYWGYQDNPYDTLLDQYEPGITVAVLDEVFAKLREAIIALRKRVEAASYQPDATLLHKKVSKEQQKAFSLRILKKMGFDFDAGRLDDTIHPFATGLNIGDVRITTRYDEANFKMAVFGIIHEGGHAIYEQNISPKLEGTPLANGASMGIHESQSLFYEIILGSSFEFWQSNYKDFQEITAPAFDDVSVAEFYRAVNISESSLVRIEADTLTYPLHIMIRYELEKAIMNGEIGVDALRDAWNDKYEEYLGVRPENDADGILQDVHWSGGDFGYFPSYALGYMYAAQLFATLSKEIPNVSEILASDDYSVIRAWLTENVHQYGMLKKPLAILRDTTGEGLNPDYLIQLLNDRYDFIYKLNEA